MQQSIGQNRARHRSGGADEENDHHPARLPPALLHVALEQQQRDAQRHRVVPDDVIIQHAAGGNDGEVGGQQRDAQGDDGAGDLGGPGVFLLQPDGQGHRHQQKRQKGPGVLRRDERGTAQPVLKQVRHHTILLPSCQTHSFFKYILSPPSAQAPPAPNAENSFRKSRRRPHIFPDFFANFP